MRFYIIRHGITDWNNMGKWQGSKDIPLNNYGIEQATLIAKRFESLHIDKIYSSPLSRAYKTAEIINQYKNLYINTKNDLCEIRLGEWEGKNNVQIKEEYSELFYKWENYAHIENNLGVESYYLLTKRSMKAINEIIEESNDDDKIIIVTHGALIKAVLCEIIGLNIAKRQTYLIDNTSLNIIDYLKNKKEFVVKSINDVSHIDG